MNPLIAAHIAAGSVALLSGMAAAVARKGGRAHARAGTCFAASMLTLGMTATILEQLKAHPELGLGGLFTCYFVATSWMAARRRDGATGRFEVAACLVALAAAGLIAWGAFTGGTTPAGPGPLFALAGVCLLAGLLDLHAVLRRTLTPLQRISRHLWRMCFAFFIATGSFFLGQQDVMPPIVRGSSALFVLAFAPFALMLFWLVRVRIGQRFRAPCQRMPA
jgi:hypothetical protein